MLSRSTRQWPPGVRSPRNCPSTSIRLMVLGDKLAYLEASPILSQRFDMSDFSAFLKVFFALTIEMENYDFKKI
jgi:hypothetical protein